MAEISKPVQVIVDHRVVLTGCVMNGMASLKRSIAKVKNPAILKALQDEQLVLDQLIRAINSL